jgi:DNA-binding IclR family transcriptional regulator
VDDDKYLMSSLSNALRVLDILAIHDRISVAELTQLSGLGKATLFKMLYTLSKRGFVYKTKDARYGLSIKFAQYGQSVLERFDLVGASRPALKELSERLGEAVHLAVLSDDGLNVTFIGKESTGSTIRMGSRIGLQLPSHCTGTGKALLAALPEAQLAELVGRIEFKRLTPHSIMSEEQLRLELESIRAEGYAKDKEESEEGLVCLGTVIRNISGSAVGAISVSGPKSRMNKNVDRNLSELRACAGKISKTMGY